MNTDTPRTDEAAVDVWRKSNGERMATSSDKVDADFARKLERELNETREALKTGGMLNIIDRAAHERAAAIRERDEARAESIRWMSIAEGRGRTDDEVENDTQSELAAWELLREAQAENIGWQNKWQVAVEMAALAQNELATVTAQRDMLAEALQELVESCNSIDSLDFMPASMPEAFEKAQQALQSLPPKP
jgi:hypothetical protein